MAFTIRADNFRFAPELRTGVAGKRVLITGAGKDLGLGQAFALQGTPAIIFPDGQRVPGYLSPEELVQELKGRGGS